jgi:hypothetical protein
VVRLIVTAHQPNLLPGASILTKLAASDQVIWLDEVQFTKGGWTNRQKMPDGSWLTIPVDRDTDGQPINRVRIADRPWRNKATKTIRQHYGDHASDVISTLWRPYGLLVGLNLALLRNVTQGGPEWVFQSHLDGGHAVRAVSNDRVELAPISERLAMMVAEVGGTVYLSGPSGFRYLDEKPFLERGVEVRYHTHTGPNPCALTYLLEGARA